MSATFYTDANGVGVKLLGYNASQPKCSGMYALATHMSIQTGTISSIAAQPNATIYIPYNSSVEALDVSLNGVSLYLMPCGPTGTTLSLLHTLTLFTTTNNTELRLLNFDFMTRRKIWPSTVPAFGLQVPVDAAYIRSGDYFAIMRLDGLDPLISFGTGSRTGHSATAVWDPRDGNLYVCESTDSNPFSGSYWPPPYGVIRTPYEKWYLNAIAADYHVVLLPLAHQYASKFDEVAYWNYFETVQGAPYGYRTLLYTFLDVGPTTLNLPLPIDSKSCGAVLILADGGLPILDPIGDRVGPLGNASDVNTYELLVEGFNRRINNNSCTTLRCVAETVVVNQANGVSPSQLFDAFAIPNDDAWFFDGNHSMVCSDFAFNAWKYGLQGSFPIFSAIRASEQTPKDNYQLAIYDPTRFNAQNCPGGLHPGGYCQMLGDYSLILQEYNTIPLYSGMNDVCPSQWPNFTRCADGTLTCC
jgi:hypothetical protein